MQARYFIDALNRKDNFEIVYITCRTPSDYRPEDHRIVRISKYGKRHKYGFFWDAAPLLRILNREKPDIIYQRVACAYTGICAAYARQTATKMIWHVASSSDCEKMHWEPRAIIRPHKLIEKKLIEYGLHHSDLIVVQTKDQMLALENNYRQGNSRLIRNFHPVPSESTKKNEPIEIIWVGNFKDCKRPEIFLELTEALADVAILNFTMAGAPYLETQEQIAFDRRISRLGNVKYVGSLSHDQVKRLMCSSHVLVNTSTREGFSNTFIEAWMNSMVVLSLGVNPDNMLNGDSLGKSFENLADLADFLKRLAKTPELLRKMGREARITAIKEFSMENADRLANILVDITDENL